ncbi:MAG: hypothetical protein HC772_02680 [Leptolyngbyaceae cyanobacterium CRU_2_3]|nr:hypothetical protein [Leptolyngbyaceae cyanobacterium CRU_2_3]
MHKLLQSVQEEAIDLGLAFPDFDPQELTALLDRRKSLDQNQRDHWTALADPLQQIPSLNDAQIRQILQGLRLAVQQISKKPRRWAARTQANLQDSSDVFQDYLQHAHKSEFHPDRIKRHLQRIFNLNPVYAETAAFAGLSQNDRPKIAAWLQQRTDLNQVEINAITSQVDSTRQ